MREAHRLGEHCAKLALNTCHLQEGHHPPGIPGRAGGPARLVGLVLNAVVFWTTPYIDAAVGQRRAQAHEIRDEDIARLPPLKHRNLNVRDR
jgi:hypothetical protein